MTARSLGVASTVALGLLVVGPGAGAAPIDLNSCQTIHSGGSYVVTQDLSNPVGHCLILEADRVTIDLNGFSVSGSGSGITSAGGQTRFLTAIRNGIVGGGSNAIDLPQGRSTVVERVRAATGNGWAILLGEEAMVKDSLAVDGNNGIAVGGRSLVVGNIASDNGAAGIVTGGATIVKDNSVSDNVGHGLIVGAGSTVSGNTARGNGGQGISVECRSVLVGNTATDNGGGDIVLNGQGCTRAHNVPRP